MSAICLFFIRGAWQQQQVIVISSNIMYIIDHHDGQPRFSLPNPRRNPLSPLTHTLV